MSKEEILARVIDLMAESFGIDSAEIFPTAHLFDDLDLDSIDAIDLVKAVRNRLSRWPCFEFSWGSRIRR